MNLWQHLAIACVALAGVLLIAAAVGFAVWGQ